MIVYHGTTMVLKKPDVTFSKNYLDFGKGFYVTTYQEQAERWALRKGVRKQMPSYINVYVFPWTMGQGKGIGRVTLL